MNNGPEIYATFYSDPQPENGSQPDANGQGCIHYEKFNATRSGTYTTAELLAACSCPILAIHSVTVGDLVAACDLPLADRVTYLLTHGAELIRDAIENAE